MGKIIGKLAKSLYFGEKKLDHKSSNHILSNWFCKEHEERGMNQANNVLDIDYRPDLEINTPDIEEELLLIEDWRCSTEIGG